MLGERGRVRGLSGKTLNAFVLMKNQKRVESLARLNPLLFWFVRV
jgi:hypothetical protein